MAGFSGLLFPEKSRRSGENEKTLNWAVEILEIQKTGLRRIWYDRWGPVFCY